jgi:hypothetical protein
MFQSKIMIISYRGRDWLVGIITISCLLLSDFLTSLYYHDPGYYAQHGWPKLAAFWVAAAIVRLLIPQREEEVLGVMPQPATKNGLCASAIHSSCSRPGIGLSHCSRLASVSIF